MTLLNEKLVLTEKDTKTNISLSFEVPEGCESLEISYSYSPKRLEDEEKCKRLIEKNIADDAAGYEGDYPSFERYMPLKNLITLSLDSPLGYVGAAHRQAEKQSHIISESFSSVGFSKTKIYKGKWTLTLNVHAVVTEKAECSVFIFSNEIRKNKQWFPCELHCHTVHSDGDFTVSSLVETAKKRGLKGICLTDHNSTGGHEEAENEPDLAVLKGIEWTTYFGHMLVLGVEGFVDWRDATVDNIDEKIKAVREKGGLVGIAHPFQLGTPICTGGHWDFKVKDFSNINYIEIFSEGEPRLNSPNRRAREFYHKKLSEGFKIAPSMGRDWHRERGNILIGACSYLLSDGEKLTGEKMKEAIKKGRIVVSVGPLFCAETESGETMGDEIEPGERKLKFTIDFERFDSLGLDYSVKPEKILIIGKNMEIKAQINAAEKEIALKMESGYYTFELYGEVDGEENELIAYTAPIYVKEEK